MGEVIVGGLAVYIFAAIMGTIQALSVVGIWYLRRSVTRAEAKLKEAQAANETATATQTTANAFDTLTGTVTKMATDFSATLMKTIDLVNSREKRIDELEEDNRQKTSDLKDLRDQMNDLTNMNVQRDNKIELLQSSLDALTTANSNQANEIIALQVRILKLQDDNQKKDAALLESNRQIQIKDDRIRHLEERVKHLEEEIKELKKPAPPAEEKAVEVKVVETKTEGVNPS